MDHIDFRELGSADHKALVRMWKESRKGWPPGFLGASEITETSVAREEKGSGRLFSVVATEGDRVLGYCRTCPYGGEPKASYVDLINVVPDRQGTGIGRKLLLDAVERSAKLGMKRIDLHTWPANLKAVPLYKKTGFHWVPDTRVYMQNYVPWLLGLEEFREFLGDSDWYSLQERELEICQDRFTTESGREVFLYRFRGADGDFTAEFDRSGRCLSGLSAPWGSARLSVNDGEFFSGRQVPVSIELTGKDPGETRVTAGEGLKVLETADDSVTVLPLARRVPRLKSEKAERVIAELDGLELSLGIRGSEEVALHGSAFRFLDPGAERVTLGIRHLGGLESGAAVWSVDGGESRHMVVRLSGDYYQSVSLEIPALNPGIHVMELQLGRAGYAEKVVLIAGVYSGEPVSVDTRQSMVVIAGDRVLLVDRRGGYSSLFMRDPSGRAMRIGRFLICPGPPSWNSDIPLQRFDLSFEDGEVRGRCLWPSKPGLGYSFRSRLHRDGHLEIRGEVKNGTDSAVRINFRGRNSYDDSMEPKSDLLPVDGGVLKVLRVYNQVPDWDEDFTLGVDGLSAPWQGVSGGGVSAMTHFSGWTEFEFDMPGTKERDLSPASTIESPPYRVLASTGDHRALLSRARALGWETGETSRTLPFLQHDLEPVMAPGAEVSLTHPLQGARKAAITVEGQELASGEIRSGESIKGNLKGRGAVRIGLDVAGRETGVPVYLIDPDAVPGCGREEEGILSISNGVLKVLLDPGACGQVFSARADGSEFLLSSRPEPSEFAWEKPWFGGIHPRYLGGSGNTPFPLEEHTPEVEEFSRSRRGLRECGWRMHWRVNHRDLGTVNLTWTVTMKPGVPLLLTEFHCVGPERAYTAGELDLRGFLQPGGSREGEIMTCQAEPGLRQGRDNAGAWGPLGRWARVTCGESFVECLSLRDGKFLCEDYGELGCHFCHYDLHRGEVSLAAEWLFGSGAEHHSLAGVLRAHS